MGMQLTWLLVADVNIETQDDDVGEESSPPVDNKHDHTTQYGSSKRNPHVVIFEAGTPPCRTTTQVTTAQQKEEGICSGLKNSGW